MEGEARAISLDLMVLRKLQYSLAVAWLSEQGLSPGAS